ncbi:MAG: SLC13 family permease [Streptosporangiaceae bacterium]
MRTVPGSSARDEPGSGPPAGADHSGAGLIARAGPWALAIAGLAGATGALLARTDAAQAAASQDWSPFVLVAGLLLIGLVADGDGLFAAAGTRLARLTGSGVALFAGASLLIGIVTAVLNLDTSVAFLTPVLVYTARSRGLSERALLYGCLLLSNAGSLLLPGSNLTNLIVLGHLRLTGSGFLARMWLPAVAALAVTAVVVAVAERRSLRAEPAEPSEPARVRPGIGLAAVATATVLVLVLRTPAIPVAAVGMAAAGVHLVRRRTTLRAAIEVLGLPVLAGLFGVAVALGTVGRAWSGPASLLAHLDSWGTAAVAGLATIAVNNLPAASLLAAKTPGHPFSLIVGLNLGPNLCVTGSLAWLLWLRAARSAGARPSLGRASAIGIAAAPLSIAAALGGLALTGSL